MYINSSDCGEIKGHVASQDFMDDPDKLTGTMPESIIVCPALRHLGVIIRFEGGIVLYHVMSSIHQCIAKDFRSSLGHPGFLRLKVTRLINGRVKTGEGEQLLGLREAVNIADFSKDHPAINGSNTRDGHDDRVEIVHKVCHLRFNVVDLAIKEFDLFDRMDYLDR